MTSADYDLGYVSAALPILEDYILSPDLYWSLAAKPPDSGPAYPQLTLGNLYLAIARLKARQLSTDQETRLYKMEIELDHMRARWSVALENKAAHSYSSRLKMWGNFLDEYRTRPENHYDRYAYEVRLRVMLRLLAPLLSAPSKVEQELLTGLDKLLQAVFIPGGFIWDGELASGFPPDPYWYLYGRLREE